MKKNEIPTQFRGKSLDYERERTFATHEDARMHYDQVVKKMRQVNAWNEITKGPSADFKVVDRTGEVLDRTVREGDFIRIDIPGPGMPSTGGYDWVQVEELVNDEQGQERWTKMVVRPCADPTGNSEDTAHFFQRMATSTFAAELEDRQVRVLYAGRNEVVNTENEAAMDNLRNFFVGIMAKIGASYPQWKALVDGLNT